VDLFEPSQNNYAGSLQIQVTNEGRVPKPKETPKVQTTSRAAVKCKKVYSKPTEPRETNVLLRSVATSYVPNENQISEEARKKLRISRMREQASDQGANSRVL
jgi:hypothetical protein